MVGSRKFYARGNSSKNKTKEQQLFKYNYNCCIPTINDMYNCMSKRVKRPIYIFYVFFLLPTKLNIMEYD